MAIRYIDTGFFKSPFVRSLKAPLKTLYSYIITECSGAGIWYPDLEIANIYCGTKIKQKDFKEAFIDTGKAIDLGDGKYFFPNFIEHQYPKGLSTKNPAQKNFILELQNYNLLDENCNIIIKKNKDPLKTLKRVIGSSKGNSSSNSKGKSEISKIIFPFDDEEFKSQWKLWKVYKSKEFKFNYKSEISEQAALKKLAELSNNNQKIAIAIIHQSISESWKGFFELKRQTNGKNNSSSGTHIQNMQKANRCVDEYFGE